MTTMTVNPPTAADRPADPDAYAVVTVLMLMLGGFVLPVVGWLAGVVMLWTGRAWTVGEKVLGTLVWPLVVAIPVAAVFLLGGPLGGPLDGDPAIRLTVLGVAALIALILLPWTFVTLLCAGRRR
ncbi:hypothetical protein WIS52_11335 [Pseudonocardia nematodicida]|uniref:Uncharacterized protein n=1 Tax=Pseudonocardia nematodicida TaxID=1206997 RepID=A0ABV1K9A4_9PSEU